MSRNGSPLITMRDDYGYKADPAYNIIERYAELGCMWWVNTVRAAVADTEAQTISFTTPAASAGRCFLNYTKTVIYGNVVDLDILEGPTLAGGSALTPRNLSRTWSATPDAGCPITDFKTGATPTGGTTILSTFLGGGANPASRTATENSSDAWFELKPSTVYMFRATAVGAVTWCQISGRVAILSNQ